jgi:hypothetical protein
MEGKAGLRIAYSNQKSVFSMIENISHRQFFPVIQKNYQYSSSGAASWQDFSDFFL